MTTLTPSNTPLRNSNAKPMVMLAESAKAIMHAPNPATHVSVFHGGAHGEVYADEDGTVEGCGAEIAEAAGTDVQNFLREDGEHIDNATEEDCNHV